jgi:hypothetical protein
MDGTGDHNMKWNKPDSEKRHMLSHVWNLEKKWHERRRETTKQSKGDGGGRIREGNGVVTLIKIHYMNAWKDHK